MATSAPPSLNLPNIQGDIILGLPKKVEEFIFFQITNVDLFRKQLKALLPLITTMHQALRHRHEIADHQAKAAGGNALGLLTIAGTNIAFSNFGLGKFGITNAIDDPNVFGQGQKKDASNLGDKLNASGVPEWDSVFLQNLDGVILITGDCILTLEARKVAVEGILFGSIKVVDSILGTVRPGNQKGHEHFGYRDGISQPAIKGFGTPHKGQDTIDAGFLLVGGVGDPTHRTSDVGTDGSFLVFRKLKQYVPEFDAFLLQNGTGFDGLSPKEGAEFLGARFVGRWKSGAPIDITPVKDDLTIAKDPEQNNNFNYSFKNPDDAIDQTRCPFSAHIRKTHPRNDLEPNTPTNLRRIMRQGIPFGKEVTHAEKARGVTSIDRGLAFVSYQSNIANSFQFLQRAWANNPNFKTQGVGHDPIIGVNMQASDNRIRTVSGLDPKNQGAPGLKMPDFVESRGGEYFFSPSIATLRDVIATA